MPTSSQFDLVGATNAQEHGTITGTPLTGDPLLAPLADNGGPTQTFALRAGSPAIDQGNSFGLTVDQRGSSRPADFAGVPNAAGDGSDIGAFERQPCIGQSDPSQACRTLRISLSGTGTGTVGGTGVACPPSCSAGYVDGSAVVLTAVPGASSSFTGWTGPCSGTGPCRLTMSVDQDLGAAFALKPSAPPAPPDTILTGAKIKAKRGTAAFRFRSVGSASGFQCRLVSKKHRKPPFKACSSPKAFTGLKPGRYRFEVRAISSSGSDPTPAKKKFHIA